MNKQNPFKLKGYHSPTLFCDRESETERLISNTKNGVNTTLLSIRRMGKTGLIHHAFQQLEKDNKWRSVYVDIYATKSLSDFTNQLATAILQTYPQEKAIGKKFIELLKGFSPSISYDSFTGMPEVKLSFNNEQQKHYSISGLFNFLEKQKTNTIIAIDEFQQISTYPETNTEALLRTVIQQLKKTQFIFSGSHRHLLIEIFNNVKRPFFASTEPMLLNTIPNGKYKSFIKRLFTKNQKKIDDVSIDFILKWTKTHTYYTQALCHKVFQLSNKIITLKEVYNACDNILREQEVVYFQYRKLLTKGQWNLLQAIAKEDIVQQPTNNIFIRKYELGGSASVLRSLNSLIEKEMIMEEIDKEGKSSYQVYDCFLSRWLAR